MIGPANATMLVLSSADVGEGVRNALRASAERLGHARMPLFAVLDELQDLELAVHEVDPWVVVAIDDVAIAALNAAFPELAEHPLAADAPMTVRGYELVAVPGFAECIDDLPAKRVAWQRLQAAKRPIVPW